MEQTLQFSASLPGHDDRARLLNDAAGMLDRRSSLLGPDGAPAETEEGRLARMFAQDQAQLGRPQVLRLAPDGLGAIGDGVPVEVAELARRNAHYWLTFPVSLWTSANRGFNRIEFKATFSAADGDSGRAPATVDAVPSQELVTRFEANTE